MQDSTPLLYLVPCPLQTSSLKNRLFKYIIYIYIRSPLKYSTNRKIHISSYYESSIIRNPGEDQSGIQKYTLCLKKCWYYSQGVSTLLSPFSKGHLSTLITSYRNTLQTEATRTKRCSFVRTLDDSNLLVWLLCPQRCKYMSVKLFSSHLKLSFSNYRWDPKYKRMGGSSQIEI